MVNVALRDLTLTYAGADRPTLTDISLDIADGEFVVLVGPSGCGKSTTLRLVAGFELPDSGTITFGDQDVTGLTAIERDVSMVFQSYALYPHMTVSGNMEFALKNMGVPKAERKVKVLEAARLLELEDYLDRKPRELSGGQRQRVAMGRAIVRQPQVFLMDEPLSNLDAKLRTQTRTQIAHLQRRLGVTTVYVTHDQTEAMTMGDRVVVMNRGRIEQVGTPRELYDNPASVFVAGFIGSPAMSLLATTRASDGRLEHRGLGLTLPAPAQHFGAVTIGVRPEDFIALSPGTEPGEGSSVVEFTVDFVEELGSDFFVYSRPTEDGGTPVVARLPKGHTPERGERLRFAVRHSSVLRFDAESGSRLA